MKKTNHEKCFDIISDDPDFFIIVRRDRNCWRKTNSDGQIQFFPLGQGLEEFACLINIGNLRKRYEQSNYI
jgi:hypothetical protein